MKYPLLLFSIFIFFLKTSLCISQTQFQRTIGGAGADFGNYIIQTSDGAYVVAGSTTSFGAGSSDFYIAKLSGDGNTILWNRTIGGPGPDYILTIIQTADGGYAVAGETQSFGAGSFDACIMRLDNNGVLLWTKTIGGTGDDYGESIIQISDGGFVIAGYTNSYGTGGDDIYIARLDSLGSLLWMKTIGRPDFESGVCVKQTTDGGFAVFGSSYSPQGAYNDYYLVKLDGSGSLQWSRTIGGAGGDYGYYFVKTTDGGYAMAGTTLSFGAGNYDLYIVKIDSSGSLQWTRTIGGPNNDYGYTIVQSNDGGYAVAGSTASFGAGGDDAFIVKLNTSGIPEWSRTIGGTNNDCVLSIKQTSDGGYIASGYTYSFGTGDADIYLIKLDAYGNTCGNTSSPTPVFSSGGILETPASITTSPIPVISTVSPTINGGGILTTLCFVAVEPVSNEIPNKFSLFQNYPNPFNPSTKISYELPVNGFVRLIIYDLLGEEVKTLVSENKIAGSYEVSWDAINMPSGVYFYKLISGDYTESKEMILLK